jgi:hypothetical protein
MLVLHLGFQHRVVRLVQRQDNLSVDGEYTVPIGTELRYTSSCKYDDKSTEISSEKDYRETLSKEAGFSSTSSRSTSASANNLFFSASSSFSSKQSFKGSEKFNSFAESTSKENTVSFEARAICSEFEANFKPYAELELDEHFAAALDELPCKYNSKNPEHVSAFSSFFSAYGTHYIRQVVLGGKRIHTSTMSSRDFSQLTREQVDVASSLSFEMQSAMGASLNVKAGMVKGVASLAGPKGAMVSNFIDVATGGDDDASILGASINDESSFSLTAFSKSSQQAEAVQKIRQKNVVTSEVNIGGLPNVDWRSWAATVKEKPMPISYEIAAIWELMDDSKAIAYLDALIHIYGLDLNPDNEKNVGLDAMHFGVVRGTGEPISEYSLNPNSDFRALLDVGLEPTNLTLVTNRLDDDELLQYELVSKTVPIITYGTTWRKKLNRPTPMFATTINGDIGSNTAEERGLSIIKRFASATDSAIIQLSYAFDDLFDIDNNVPFGISFDSTSAGRIAMTNFIEGKEAEDLPSFSFLTVENLPKNQDRIWSGVVSNDGLLLTPFGAGDGVEVTITSTSTSRNSKTFDVVVNGDEEIQDATVILFSEFFASKGETTQYPKDVGQVAIGTYGWASETGKTGKFSVKIGKKDDYTQVGSSFGFNFLVLAGGLDTTNVKHGYVHGVPDELNLPPQDHVLNGLEVGPLDFEEATRDKITYLPAVEDSYEPSYRGDITGYSGSVHVQFTTPFDALPSVTVTPVLLPGLEGKLENFEFKLANQIRTISVPKCLVETITKTDCHIKCGMVIASQKIKVGGPPTNPAEYNGVEFEYIPLPFNIVAVGPSAL